MPMEFEWRNICYLSENLSASSVRSVSAQWLNLWSFFNATSYLGLVFVVSCLLQHPSNIFFLWSLAVKKKSCMRNHVLYLLPQHRHAKELEEKPENKYCTRYIFLLLGAYLHILKYCLTRSNIYYKSVRTDGYPQS